MQAAPRPKVVCAWDLSVAGDHLGSLADVADIIVVEPTREAIAAALPGAVAYLATLHVRFTDDLLALAPDLKVIGTPSTGLDHLDMPSLQQRNVQVIGLKDETAFLDDITSTAELAWGLILACVRHIPPAHAAAVQGRWARDAYRGRQLAGQTLGILGVGRLGRMMATYAQAFRMRVIGCDHRPITTPHVQPATLDQLLAQSDILTIHIHLTDDNRNLINRDRINAMKPGAVLINTSRGGIIDELALRDALLNNHLAAAGLDVIDGEWRTDLADHPLIAYARDHDNLTITPHIGGVTDEAQQITCAFTANRVAAALTNLP